MVSRWLARWSALALLLVLPVLSHAAGLRLAWDYTQGTDPAVKFRVYRQVGCAGAYVALTPDVQPVALTPTLTTYTFLDSTLAVGQTYCYHATAFNATGKESGVSVPPVTFQMLGVLNDPVNMRGTLEP